MKRETISLGLTVWRKDKDKAEVKVKDKAKTGLDSRSGIHMCE